MAQYDTQDNNAANGNNGHVCSMHELMQRKIQQLGEMIENGQYDPKSGDPLPFRVYPECIDCMADYECGFYRKEIKRIRRASSTAHRNDSCNEEGIEKVIGEAMPQKTEDKGEAVITQGGANDGI